MAFHARLGNLCRRLNTVAPVCAQCVTLGAVAHRLQSRCTMEIGIAASRLLVCACLLVAAA